MLLTIPKSDESIAKAMVEKIESMQTLTAMACCGNIPSLIVSGPAGLGKSHLVEEIAHVINKKYSIGVSFVKGHSSPKGLFEILYKNRHKNSVLVFDDCDSVFDDEKSLNLLKAACDSSSRRFITWASATECLDDEGNPIPKSFEFSGSVIFITNLEFEKMADKNSKMAPHFKALMSRSYYINLGMRTVEEAYIRILQVIQASPAMVEGMSQEQVSDMLSFVKNNLENMNEVSLRSVKKLQNLIKASSQWKTIAQISLMKN